MENLAGTDAQHLMSSLGPLPEIMARPVFIVVSGLPGTGKTYFSNQLRQRLHYVILKSDALRKMLFAHPVYTAEESAYLFKVIHALIV